VRVAQIVEPDASGKPLYLPARGCRCVLSNSLRLLWLRTPGLVAGIFGFRKESPAAAEFKKVIQSLVIDIA
jgi:hypothetical protein